MTYKKMCNYNHNRILIVRDRCQRPCYSRNYYPKDLLNNYKNNKYSFGINNVVKRNNNVIQFKARFV